MHSSFVANPHWNSLQSWPPAALQLPWALNAAAEAAPVEPALGYEGAFPFLATPGSADEMGAEPRR
ncbi:hypothetical protein G8A07_22375 [Roseateles sp. DAIF2]|uniref:hypothetical protein n=1 Tax=Roseateles sp. DAIF2 TaxID=2714952 RepID=UPI0018A28E39|nr:hypothetical protein [Roseateles sp. DAIF2]QPF75394.1 hypothetical protein G8A07_22375 [Roseateles sp. DAIF2]